MTRTSIADLQEAYRDGEPVAMLTAYDAPIAGQVDAGGRTRLRPGPGGVSVRRTERRDRRRDRV